MKIKFIKEAELIGNPETGIKSIRYNGKVYELKQTSWDEAEKEARVLLNKIYPNEIIHIR